MARVPKAKLYGLGFVFLWFLIGGAAVLVSGVFELLGAVGLLILRLPVQAALLALIAWSTGAAGLMRRH